MILSNVKEENYIFGGGLNGDVFGGGDGKFLIS